VILTSLGLIFGLACVAPFIARFARPLLGLLAAALLAGIGIWFAASGFNVAPGETTPLPGFAWAPDLGVDIAWRIDGLSLTFALLISFIAACVMLYAGSYMKDHARMGSFFATLLAFTGSMVGLVLAENMLVIFIFWELTSITSYLLIGFDSERESARRCALQSLLVTGIGGLALLAGVILLGFAAGGFNVQDVLDAELTGGGLLTPAIILILVGCFTKSANFPFHFWLPNAMEAPTPVSALLHSSTMVKAGVYLAARLSPGLHGIALWDNLLIVFGAITMVYGAFLATRRFEFKKILAYSTVSSLGILIMLIGLGAYKAMAVYLMAHAFFKGCLFLVAGIVIHAAHTKKPETLGGLRATMPITAGTALLATLSFAGFMPFAGFAGKELMLKAGLEAGGWLIPLRFAAVLAAILTVLAAFVVGIKPFFGPRPQGLEKTHDPDVQQFAGPALLAVLGVIGGVAPFVFAGPLATAAASAMKNAPVEPVQINALALMLKPSWALLISVFALASGIGLYVYRDVYHALLDRLPKRIGPTFDTMYDVAILGLNNIAKWQTAALQRGSLRWYARVTIAGAAVLIGLSVLRASLPPIQMTAFEGSTIIDWMLGALIAFSAVASVMQRKALAAIAVLGTVGFVGALVFLLYGAPDVAMTQLATETLIVIIFVLVIYHLPRFSKLTSRRGRIVDAVIATCLGAFMSVLTLVAVAVEPAGGRISQFHADKAFTEAYGRNIINVILVDFRAIDTLGEIFVLGAAAVGLFVMLRPGARGQRRAAVPGEYAGHDTAEAGA